MTLESELKAWERTFENIRDQGVIVFSTRRLEEPLDLSIGFDFEISEPHPLDKKYPHKCFQCSRELIFNELKERNKDMNEKELKRMWKSPYVQFYCCSCFDEEDDDD